VIPQNVRADVTNWWRAIWASWDRFLFTAVDPATLALIRICTGAMLLYTHFVWALELQGFFGKDAWLSKDFAYRYHDSVFGWSHLYWIDNAAILWITHLAALAVFACLMVGYRSRTMAVLSYLLTVSYANRAGGALFGLDQINGFLSMYLMIGPCGAAFSVDEWIARAKSNVVPAPTKSVSANIALRLMQLHLCVVYLFAGLGKLLGESWWDGTALWGAFANYEYQTIDMTWLAHWLVIINFLTHITLIWEISYCFLIWNRLARPVMLLLSIPLHLGIALCMGMITFGLIMIVANMAFLPPDVVRAFFNRILPQRPRRKTKGAAAELLVNEAA